jgi:hypothetical protein
VEPGADLQGLAPGPGDFVQVNGFKGMGTFLIEFKAGKRVLRGLHSFLLSFVGVFIKGKKKAPKTAS